MMTPSREIKAIRDGVGATPYLASLIDQTITRFTREWNLFRMPVGLQFPAELEAAFEAETKRTRVRELRITVSASIILLVLITVTDGTFVPDLGWNGLYIRLVASVFLMAAVCTFHRLSGPRRELVLCAVAYISILALAVVPLISSATRAPYGLFVWLFALIYCNTTTPLRFRYALPFTLLCVITIVTLTPLTGRVGTDLADALAFLATIGAAFSLIANYRMERSVRLRYLLASKESLRLVALHRDRDQLATISSTDALTGVSNRGHFDRRLATLFNGSAEPGMKIGLILMDVDHFKRYNDHYGHPAGDACLMEIAAVVTRIMRGKRDFGFRYGGEEFGALLLEVTGGVTESIAERIRLAVEREGLEHANREDGIGIVTVSVGVASAAVGDGGTAKELIARADASLYAAKRAGRNRTVFLSRADSAA